MTEQLSYDYSQTHDGNAKAGVVRYVSLNTDTVEKLTYELEESFQLLVSALSTVLRPMPVEREPSDTSESTSPLADQLSTVADRLRSSIKFVNETRFRLDV